MSSLSSSTSTTNVFVPQKIEVVKVDEFEPTRACPIASVNLASVIKCFSYDELVRNNIVPNLKITQSVNTKKYPQIIYDMKKRGNENGQKILESLLKFDFLGYTSENFPQLFVEKLNLATNMNFRVDEINWKSIISLQKFINTTLTSFSSQQQISLRCVINSCSAENLTSNIGNTGTKITSVADICTASHLIAISVIGNISNEFETVILQLLAQKAFLDRQREQKISFLGILLPIHETIQWFNVENWNSSLFYDICVASINSCVQDLCVARPPILEQMRGGIYHLNIFGYPCKAVNEIDIGTHVAINDNFPTHIPFQTFISNPQGHDFISDTQLALLLNKRELSGDVKWFVHAAYLINLCNHESNSIAKLQHELIASRTLRCKGCVFHVGKHTSQTYEVGFANMIAAIKYILPNATIETPLILETPAGQGSEIGSSYESFCTILNQFPNEIGKTFRVCVDTCHVFSLGYDPLWFIENLEKTYPNSVAVVHFNDSSNPRGERVDRHYIAGLGYIGYERMKAVYTYCKNKNIPLIRE